MSDNLPSVTSNIPRDLRTFVDRVRDTLGAGGARRIVTVDQLARLGLATINAQGNPIPATDGGTFFVTPPPPTNVAATAAIQNIIVEWDSPNYRGHSYAEVWVAGVDDLGQAVLLGSAPGGIYVDSVGPSITRYYWVRFVNVEDTKGPYNALTGVTATTGPDVDYVLGILTGRITESELFASLQSRINLIDGSPDIPGTIPNRLALLQGEINELSQTPVYDNSATYSEGTLVQYEGGLYQALSSTTGNLPTDTTFWLRVGDYSSLGEAVAIQAELLNTVTTNLGAEVTARQALATQMRGGYTGTDLTAVTSGLLHSEATTRANADTALSSQITTLASTVTTNNSTQTAAIQTEATTRANADTALSGQITTLQSTVTTNNSTQTAAIQTEATTRANADTALFAQYTVKVDVNGFVSGFGLASQTIDGVPVSDFQIRADRFSITNPSTTLVTVNSLTRSSTTATLTTASAHGLVVGDKFTLRGVTNDTNWNGAYTVLTRPSTTQITFTVGSTLVTPATGTMRVGKTAIPFIVDSGVVYMAEAMIKDGTITNVKIGTAAIDDAKIASLSAGKITTGTLSADRIATGSLDAKIANIDAAIITSGFIDTARIQDATITAAKITNATITAAKIVDATITAAKIQDATITTAKIADTLQSTNYAAGTAGWQINKSGTMELNSATFRGTIDVKSSPTGARLEIKNNTIKVFDASGVLRVQIGDLSA